MKPKQSIIKSFRNALRGIYVATAAQRNMKLHSLAAMVVLIVACVVHVTLIEWSLLILCIGFVMSAEIMNTAIETTVDLASPEYHELARNAKDISAGAVLTTSITAAIVGILILLPKLWTLVNRLPG